MDGVGGGGGGGGGGGVTRGPGQSSDTGHRRTGQSPQSCPPS